MQMVVNFLKIDICDGGIFLHLHERYTCTSALVYWDCFAIYLQEEESVSLIIKCSVREKNVDMELSINLFCIYLHYAPSFAQKKPQRYALELCR